MQNGDKVKWKVDQAAGAWSGWGVVIETNVWTANGEAPHVLVEVHEFPDWLGALNGKFHPVIRCAVTWLTPL